MTPGLAALLHPHAVEEVGARLADGAPFVLHGARDALEPLFDLPLLASREALLGAWPDQVQVHLPAVATGGRVLAITGLGPGVAEAQERAYAGVEAIVWPEGFYRLDIGWRALARS